MKIIRGKLDDIAVYAHDEKNGLAEVSCKEFYEYQKALETLVAFENKVDLQYEKIK